MQIPAPHQAEGETRSELCTFPVGGLPARHTDILSKTAPDTVISWTCTPPRNVRKHPVCPEVLGLRCPIF